MGDWTRARAVRTKRLHARSDADRAAALERIRGGAQTLDAVARLMGWTKPKTRAILDSLTRIGRLHRDRRPGGRTLYYRIPGEVSRTSSFLGFL